MPVLDEVACLLQKRAILDPGRACHFACATAQAQIDMLDAGILNRQAAVLQRTHDINTPARRFVFVPGLQVRRAGAQAKAAVNAGERFLLVEKLGRGGHAL